MNIEESEDESNRTIPVPVRWEIVHLKKEGYSGEQIAQQLSVSKSAANKIYQKYLETGDIEDLKRSGRPVEVKEEEKKELIDYTKDHSDSHLEELIEGSNFKYSKMTASRVLKEGGIVLRARKVKWSLLPKDRERRLAWAREYENLPEEFWKRVVFTDESKVQFNSKTQKVWIAQGTSPDPIERDRWQVSILVWGAIKFNQTSILEFIDGTLDSTKFLDILKRRLMKNLPGLRNSSPLDLDADSLVFQQDNSRVHTAQIIKSYFDERAIYILPWPPKSPDLNLIENVWSELKNGLKSSYKTQEELEEDTIKVWKNIPSNYINSLYNSMRDRIRAVIEAEGGPTDY